MAVKTKSKGIGIKKAYKKLSAQIGKSYSVGFHDDEVATYMQYNEYGTRGIPSRPFFRKALAAARRKMRREAIKGARKRGRPSMKMASQALANQVQLEILNMSSPSNAPSTIRAKGFDDPLIASGRAYDNVRVKRVRKLRRK